MGGSIPEKDIFAALDRAPVPEAWWPDLSRALIGLGETVTPIDRPILAPLVGLLSRHRSELQIQAGEQATVKTPRDVYQDHPGSATLFLFLRGRPEGLERLVCIGLCSLLEARGKGLNKPKRLLSMLRGALERQNSRLPGVLGAVTSIPELVRLVENDEAVRNALPPDFIQLWESWLSDTLVRWMLADPARMRQALEPRVLLTQIEDLRVPVSLEEGETESGLDLSCLNTPATEPRVEMSAPVRVGRAASEQLERESLGDLLAPAELRIPKALDERLCREALSHANQHVDQDRIRAEPLAALALLLAGGVREIDLKDVVWGAEGDAKPHAIDPELPVLYRRLKRPANAVVPPKLLAGWLEPTTDVIAWPLPSSLHALFLKLSGGSVTIGQAILPMLAASPASPYKLRDVIKKLIPEANVGALAPRLALASEIAEGLGTEMAQLAMADTFGMSSVPAYYSSLPENELAAFIASIQARRFGEDVVPAIDRTRYVGSRLVLKGEGAQLWPRMLSAARKAASQQPEDLLTDWEAHRNHLVAALCCATGHRPEDALGRIFTWDVIPEYGLIILQDKQVDTLRATRVAATGRLWLSDLRRYLDRLIAMQHLEGALGKLARAILSNEQPLFSLPGPGGEIKHMTAASLRQGMPAELQTVDNFYRHRLAQKLQEFRVDAELRHAQLGWVVSPAHLHSDLSPRSPVDQGRDLETVLDDLLVADGWYLPSARKTRWTWDGVPMPPPVDWKTIFTTQERQHQENLKRIRVRLKERWKEYEADVLERLSGAFQEYQPSLRVDVEKKCLVKARETGDVVELTADHHGVICDRVRLGDQDPSSGLEAAMARILLYRHVRRAREKGIVQGPIPTRPFFSVTSDPSPFVSGLGAAVRQAHAIRRDLESKAATGFVRDQAQLTVWSILAFSMYRRMTWARAAAGAAKAAVRARKRDHVIRLATLVDGARVHFVFSGVPAMLLSRRKRHAPTSPAPSRQVLNDWAVTHLAKVEWSRDGAAVDQIENTLAAAGRIEQSGVERLLFQVGTETAAESPSRCIANDDDWPVITADAESEDKDGNGVEPPIAATKRAIAGPRSLRRDYARLIGLLNKRKFGRLRASRAGARAKAGDGKHGWRNALRGELEKLHDEVRSDTNLANLVGYVLHHLRYGSEDGSTLQQNSLKREISQIGWPLLALLAGRNLLDLTGEELQRLYRGVLLSKSVAARPYAFEELQRLHRFLVRVHGRTVVDMSELSILAGSRQKVIKPGLLTRAETRVVYEELQVDYEKEVGRDDASPEFMRLAQLRQVFFLILEASGIRPGSANGLTLGDIHFLGDAGDFVHIRTGSYGEAKTNTSRGFFKLESALWDTHRGWIEGWVNQHRDLCPENWRDLPLFAVRPGQWTRVNEHHLTSRINALLKWVSASHAASCYWLRKSRISERFTKLAKEDSISARGVYAAMVRSGHAWIQATVESYINDPSSLIVSDLKNGSEAPRSAMLAMSGLDAGPLDAAWRRAGRDGATRMRVVLDRLSTDVSSTPGAHRTTPPTLRRFKPLRPLHVVAYARERQRHKSVAEAALAAGVTSHQAEQFDRAASELVLRRGCAPWHVSRHSNSRLVMPVPRAIAGSEKLFTLLKDETSDGLLGIAESWVAQPLVARLYGADVVMQIEPNHLSAAHALIERFGIEMKVVTSDGHHLLKELPRAKHMKGHGAALRWVLSIIWIYSHATEHTWS